MLRGNCVLDLVEELRVRQWARRNWVPETLRDLRWHPVILEEMHVRDQELSEHQACAARMVPIAADSRKLPAPHFLQTPARHAIPSEAADVSEFELHYG
jgi:hypothetical protein